MVDVSSPDGRPADRAAITATKKSNLERSRHWSLEKLPNGTLVVAGRQEIKVK